MMAGESAHELGLCMCFWRDNLAEHVPSLRAPNGVLPELLAWGFSHVEHEGEDCVLLDWIDGANGVTHRFGPFPVALDDVDRARIHHSIERIVYAPYN